MAEGMTKTQLAEFVREQLSPLIKEYAGKEVADVVRESVAATLKAVRPEGFANQMFGNEQRQSSKRGAGMAWARCLRAVAAAKLRGAPTAEGAVEALKRWGDDDLAKAWSDVQEKSLVSNSPIDGGFLVPTQFSTDVIELLRPSAVVRSLDPVVLPMPNGSVKVPRITAGSTAQYVGESIAPNASQPEFGQLSLTFKKLITVVPISNDLIRFSSPQADSIVRDDSVRQMATREDRAFLRDNGTDATPKGLKHWINASNKFNANGTVNLANVTIDLGKALQKLMAADVPLIIQQHPQGGEAVAQAVTARPGWIFSPRTYMYLTTVQNGQGFYAFRPEMMNGTLWGFPFRVTSQVPETYTAAGAETGGTQSEVYFGAFAHAIIGESLGLMVDASTDAAYNDAGGTVRAAFSHDQTVIRVLAEHDFALRHDKAFSLIQNVTWGA